MGVIPIVNENDTLAVSEIKFGDNDTLSAISAAMIHADLLFLMTDVDCLYDKNPRTNPDAKAIEVVDDFSILDADGKFLRPRDDVVAYPYNEANGIPKIVSSAGSSLGTGGMGTKIVAAKLATLAGVTTIITRSSNPGNILGIVRHLHCSKPTSSSSSASDTDDVEPIVETTTSLNLLDRSTHMDDDGAPPLHTRFVPASDPISDRYFWLLHTPHPHGTLFIDEGCHRALMDKAGLLPVGIVDVAGNFAQHEVVRLAVVSRKRSPGPDGRLWDGEPMEVGRALVNYASPEISRIMGHQSTDIENILGYADSEYVAHRSHIGFFRKESRPVTPINDLFYDEKITV